METENKFHLLTAIKAEPQNDQKINFPQNNMTLNLDVARYESKSFLPSSLMKQMVVKLEKNDDVEYSSTAMAGNLNNADAVKTEEDCLMLWSERKMPINDAGVQVKDEPDTKEDISFSLGSIKQKVPTTHHFCKLCRKMFTTKLSLQLHLRMHSGEKRYKCKVCDKGFANSWDLTKHMRIHTGEKPYKCNVCERGFAQSGNLSMHMRIHTGEKPFECSVCAKTFAQSSILYKHKTIHTGQKRFQCKN